MRLNCLISDNVVKTYFNGQLTQSQLIGIVITAVLVVLALVLLKKVLKAVITIVLIIGCCIYLGVLSPSHIGDFRDALSSGSTITTSFNSLVSKSNKIKVENKNKGMDVSIKVGTEWVSLSDITSFIASDNNSYTVNTEEKSFEVNDKYIIELLNLLKN